MCISKVLKSIRTKMQNKVTGQTFETLFFNVHTFLQLTQSQKREKVRKNNENKRKQCNLAYENHFISKFGVYTIVQLLV